MKTFVLCLLFGAPLLTQAELHTLTYIYTGLSGGATPREASHDFMAMGVLDGHVIDYYDSDAMTKVPKQPWMAEELRGTYWEHGSLSRRSKQQWFKVNMDILLQRMGHNHSDLHVLQWLHGCRGQLHPNGSLTFDGGVDTYSYDGQDFLSFDYEGPAWVATAPAALETKRKWDAVQLLKDYTRAYLDTECISWMKKFLEYQRHRAQHKPPATVEVFARKAGTDNTLLLSCLASGFAHKGVVLEIRRNGRTLTKEDGVASSGVRPNEDDTFQRREGVEILQNDVGHFTCVLRHNASGLHVETHWDGELLNAPEVDVVGVVCGVLVPLVILVAVLGCLWYRKLPRKRPLVNFATPQRWPSAGAVNKPASADEATKLSLSSTSPNDSGNASNESLIDNPDQQSATLLTSGG
ncbi:major histocompatibility complex class I-related protein 1-like [Vanacampus margaritifer]